MRYIRCGLVLASKSSWFLAAQRQQSRRFTSSLSADRLKQRRPLNILFCGSDEFSVASLKCLYGIKKEDPSFVESIDVLCRTDKKVGTGLKTTNQVKKLAGKLDLPVHQIDTFDAFRLDDLSSPINLIIAVSFGLLIPAFVIESAAFGGLNVHPSFLPDLRGAAPIHHAFLNRRSHTGVSIQTLHPTKFDHGKVISRTPLPGIALSASSSPGEIMQRLAKEGARLLHEVVEFGTYMGPLEDQTLSAEELSIVTNGQGPARAPRFSKSDMRADFKTMTTAEIILRLRTFEELWDDTIYERLTGKSRRLIFEKMKDVSDESALRYLKRRTAPGEMILSGDGGPKNSQILIGTADGGLIHVRTCTIAGHKPSQGQKALYKLLAEKRPSGVSIRRILA